jgi:hypothetical protein
VPEPVGSSDDDPETVERDEEATDEEQVANSPASEHPTC